MDRLSGVLADAYYTATQDERESELKQQAADDFQQASTGLIGSIPSGSVKADDVSLTAQEKLYAQKMNIAEKDYLEKKVEIANRKGDLA